MYEPRDEISLRELYLIFRRGFWAIAAVTVLAGVAAYFYLGSKAPQYVATATVQILPPQPAASAELASLVPRVGLGVQAYTSLAMSEEVLRKALGFPAEGAPAGMTPAKAQQELARFMQSIELKTLDASNQAPGQLTLEHIVRNGDPNEAAKRANAWAQASASAAAAAMRRSLDSAMGAAKAELSVRDAELSSARTAWTEFSKQDSRTPLQSQLAQLAQQGASMRARLAQLESLIASTGAQQALLIDTVGARQGVSSDSLDAQVQAIVEGGGVSPDMAARLKAALTQLPPGLTAGGQDLLNLVSRARLESLTAELAGQVAEREQLRADFNESEADAATLRTQLADLEQRAFSLQLVLNNAQAAYDQVAAVIPLLILQQGMVADSARVIVAASAPLQPSSTNRLTLTLVAALVAGLIATVLVFLRAAVAEPKDLVAAPPAPAQAARPRTEDGEALAAPSPAGGRH